MVFSHVPSFLLIPTSARKHFPVFEQLQKQASREKISLGSAPVFKASPKPLLFAPSLSLPLFFGGNYRSLETRPSSALCSLPHRSFHPTPLVYSLFDPVQSLDLLQVRQRGLWHCTFSVSFLTAAPRARLELQNVQSPAVSAVTEGLAQPQGGSPL